MEQTKNKYFETECTKCDEVILVKEIDRSSSDYYLCQTCAMAKIGGRW